MSRAALSLLERYSWPGNVRELRNVIERAVLLCAEDVIDLAHLPVEKLGRTMAVGHRLESRTLVITAEPGRTAPQAAATDFAVSPTLPSMTAARERTVGSGSAGTYSFRDAEPDARAVPALPPRVLTHEELEERGRIVRALEQAVGNQTTAARMLGITRRALITRLERYALPRPRRRG